MYLAKHLTDASLPEIGRQFGGKHHTTVLHSVDKIEEARKTDKDLNRLLNKLTESFGRINRASARFFTFGRSFPWPGLWTDCGSRGRTRTELFSGPGSARGTHGGRSSFRR